MTTQSSSKVIASIAMLALTGLAGCTQPEETGGEEASTATAEIIYYGGDVITMDADDTIGAALAVADGRILAVGAEESVFAYRTDSTEMVDLQGGTLAPGFIDGHSHYFNALFLADQVNLYPPPAGPGKDVDSIIAALERFAEDRGIPEGEMIMAYGYDDTVMPDGRLLNRDDLDAAFPDNPVRVDHVSMHGAVLNSLALRKYGIDADTETPPGGIIVRKPGTSEPWGLIMETAFIPIFEQTPPLTETEEIEGTRAAHRMYAAAGLTTAHEGATHLPQLETMKRAADAGAHSIDVVVFPFITDLEKVLAVFPPEQWGEYRDRLKIGGVKITIDGSPQGRTAAFTTPYLTGGPSGEEDWKGELFAPQEVINAGLKKVYELGVPVNFHANGDAAIDSLIEAHEFAAADDPARHRNVTAIHSQFLRRDQVDAFVEYGIRPSFYTLHTYYFAEAHIANRGREQADYISPMRDAIDAGLRPSNHTDAPVVPLDQMFMLWSAVNRVSRAGEEIGPAQTVTPLEGLKTMTLWAAEQYGEQDRKGSLEPGKLADLVILDDNPLTVDPMSIRDIRVVETIKDGRTVFRAE